MKRLVLLLGIAMLGIAAPAQQPRVERPPFTLSIVPNENQTQEKERTIYLGKPFHVVLTNVSGTAKSVYEDWCSWGFFNLSFEVVTADGSKFTLSRGNANFTRNFPATFNVPPGGCYVFDVTWDDENWSDLSKAIEAAKRAVKGSPLRVKIRAIFEEPPPKFAWAIPKSANEKQDVWTGRIESTPEQMIIWN